MENNIKVVFFDMEGTLFSSPAFRADGTKALSAWPLIAEALGPNVTQEDYAYYQKWLRGEYESYVPWMEDTSTLFKKYGLKKQIFDSVIRSIDYFPGVKEAIDNIHSHGIRTGVITGGFYEQAERAQRELGVHHVRASCRFFWNDDETLSRWDLEEHGLQGKITAAQAIADQYGISLAECAFVGDGSNDVHIARSVGTSVAFNGHPELQKVCTHAVNQPKGEEDFRAVLDYLLPYVYSKRSAPTRTAGL